MPRRSIPVQDLTAGQGCARFERLRHTGLVVFPLWGGAIWLLLGLGYKARIRGTTDGRGRELFKV
jgi:hypothetical protein